MKLPEKSVSITFWLIDLYGNIFRCVRWVGWLVLPFQKFTQCFWTVTEFLKDLWLLRHLITVMRQHDLTKKNYLPTYPPTYLPIYVPLLENTLKEWWGDCIFPNCVILNCIIRNVPGLHIFWALQVFLDVGLMLWGMIPIKKVGRVGGRVGCDHN